MLVGARRWREGGKRTGGAARREDGDLLLEVIRRVRRGPHLIPVHEHLQLLERAAPVEAGSVATVRAEEFHRVGVARGETGHLLLEVVARALCSMHSGTPS